MEKFRQRYGPWALVAGAAEGLGAAFSRNLAGKGLNLIMADVNGPQLSVLALQLQDEFGIQTIPIPIDLAQPEAVARVMDQIPEDCRLLVYNAAYGPVKPFLANTSRELDYYLDLNSRALLQMVYAFSKHLEIKGAGGILLMSSLAGRRGTRLVAPYGATKAFIFNLAEALHHELKPLGIDVSACCAGPIATQNYLNTRPREVWLKPRAQSPEQVAEEALSFLGRKAVGIPGAANRLSNFILERILPRKWAVWITNYAMEKMYN